MPAVQKIRIMCFDLKLRQPFNHSKYLNSEGRYVVVPNKMNRLLMVTTVVIVNNRFILLNSNMFIYCFIKHRFALLSLFILEIVSSHFSFIPQF